MKHNVYTLDVAKWRCGGSGRNNLGKGSVSMINKEGYMCCLGQFATKSIEYEAGDEDSFGYPADLGDKIDVVYDNNFVEINNHGCIDDTALSEDLVAINDDPHTTPKEKIELIRERLKQEGIKLIVKNAKILES